MTEELNTHLRFFERGVHQQNLGAYGHASHCLAEETKAKPEWREANRLLNEASDLIRGFNYSEADFMESKRLFLSALIHLNELGLDLQELPFLAVNPIRHNEVREAFDLPPLEIGEG